MSTRVYVHALHATQCVFFPRVKMSIATASQYGPSCTGARVTLAVALSHGCWVDVWKQLELVSPPASEILQSSEL